MTYLFKPQASTPPHFWNWVSLSGKDAPDFLHRITTVNVKNLRPGQGSPGCILSAQGKIRAYFTLWRTAQDSFFFELDGGNEGKWKQDLLTVIDEFTFGEKISVTDVSSEKESIWLFMSPSEEGFSTRFDSESEVQICNHGSVDYGQTWMTAWGPPSALSSWLQKNYPDSQPVDFQQLEAWRIMSLRPRVDIEISHSSVPLELGLADTIAGNKGCYPGQEVIEKIIALGSPARRLARIEGEGSGPEAGEKIMNLAEPPAEVGQITSKATLSGKFMALGLIRKIHAKEDLLVRFSGSENSQGAIVKIASYT